MGDGRGACRVFVGKPEGNRPLGRSKRRWDDIKMDLQEVGWEGVYWINLAKDNDMVGPGKYGNEFFWVP